MLFLFFKQTNKQKSAALSSLLYIQVILGEEPDDRVGDVSEKPAKNLFLLTDKPDLISSQAEANIKQKKRLIIQYVRFYMRSSVSLENT